MNFTDYVHNHLIDLDLMSKDELNDLVNSIYDQIDKNLWWDIREHDPKLLDLLSDLQDQLNQDDKEIHPYNILSWISRYKYFNS